MSSSLAIFKNLKTLKSRTFASEVPERIRQNG
jgi:hypothetical protein